MPGQARHTDIWCGVCCCHDPPCVGMCGPIITFSPDTVCNELNVARLTDVTIGFCGHPGVIVTASEDVFTNELGNARLGDAVTGCNVGVIVTASEDVFLDD